MPYNEENEYNRVKETIQQMLYGPLLLYILQKDLHWKTIKSTMENITHENAVCSIQQAK